MTSKVQPRRRKTAPPTDSIEALYLELVKLMYDKQDFEGARNVAARLEALLSATPDAAGTIRASEIQSLIAELRGNLAEAARWREAEIRKILELHSLAINTPDWPFIARQYDFSDVSDRLDLLAMLYDQQGETDRAISTLVESQQYCQSHRVPFDGQELLNELQQAQNGRAALK